MTQPENSVDAERAWERGLAAECMARRLEKEYHTDPVVHAALQMARRGDVSLVDAMVACIKNLCERNAALSKEVEKLSLLVSPAFTVGGGFSFKAQPK